MTNFSDSGHPTFRASSAFERGELRSKGGGKKSFHFNGGDGNIELLLRTVISANQLSVYGAIADSCNELSEDLGFSEKPAAPDHVETLEILTGLFAGETQANAQQQGNLVQEYERKFKQLPEDQKLSIRSHFGSSTQSARSCLCVFTLPSCSLMATAIDEATIVQAIMHGLASGRATRQMVAVAASAILRTHRGDQRGDGLHQSMQEKLKAVAQDFFGHEVGISQVVKHLRLNEHADLAKAVTAQHKCRTLAAHPAGDLDVRVRLAFEKTFVKKDPLMDNDPWKQKVAVKNVDHVVTETSNNDVAAERAVRNCCCSGKRYVGTPGAAVAHCGHRSPLQCSLHQEENKRLLRSS